MLFGTRDPRWHLMSISLFVVSRCGVLDAFLLLWRGMTKSFSARGVMAEIGCWRLSTMCRHQVAAKEELKLPGWACRPSRASSECRRCWSCGVTGTREELG